jgi:hypothetical protein
MSIIKHEWWVTPVWEIDTGFDLEFNKKLIDELSQCTPKIDSQFNLWDYKTPYILKLKETILNSVI